jgi:hypothetical protein
MALSHPHARHLHPVLCAVSFQDKLGKQAKRVQSQGDLIISKSGVCRSEELPQNTIIAPCDSSDLLQQWSVLPENGTIFMGATGECLQLDSGQTGDCRGANKSQCSGGQNWKKWTNNAASFLCGDPSSCCGAQEQMWTVDAANKTVVNKLTKQCLTLHAGGMHNVGVSPCSTDKAALQSWVFQTSAGSSITTGAGQFVLSPSSPPTDKKMCLARTDDIKPGQTEVWAGPLDGGDVVVLVFNRGMSTPTPITALWSDIGLQHSDSMKVTDLWSDKELGVFSGNLTVAGVEVHGTRVFRLSRAG